MKYLDPKADLTFKLVFGEHPDLVMSFLNALLPLQAEEEITEIEYLPWECPPEHPLRKYSVVDLCCKSNLGHQFNAEIQIFWTLEFMLWGRFTTSEVYVHQPDFTEKYILPQPVYSLILVNDIFEPEPEEYYHHYRIVHVEHSDRVIDGLQLVFVELPKFKPHAYAEKKMQVLWLRYLTEIGEMTREVPAELLESPEIKKAMTVLEESAFSPEQLLGYEKFCDIISVERILMNGAERKGMEKGLKEGMEKGLEEGMERGKREEKLLIASTAKKQGLSSEMISSLTGLSIKEINKL